MIDTTDALEKRLREFQEMPILFEDEPLLDEGETASLEVSAHILRYGIAAHLGNQAGYRVYSHVNLHYQPSFPDVHVSPDVMVVAPTAIHRLEAYFIDADGSAPLLLAEAVSTASQDFDLGFKTDAYALIGVAKYLLVDLDGSCLAERLLLKQLQPDRTWIDRQDADKGVTSRLGFRVIIDDDGRLRVLEARTGRKYLRPDEAASAMLAAEERLLALQDRIRMLEDNRT